MTQLLNLISHAALLAGMVFLLIGCAGLLRLPDFFTRLHAASIIDTLGCIFIISGLILQSGSGTVALKLFLILILILFASPTATHALAKSALQSGLRPWTSRPSGDDK